MNYLLSVHHTIILPSITKGCETKHYIMKIPNKQEFQQTNHSSDIDFDCLKRLFRNITTEPYSILVIDTTLSSDDPLHF